MAWMSPSELSEVGFAHVGVGARISTRAAIYDPERISIGDFSRVDDFCLLSGKLTIGRNVHITAYVNLAGGEEGIEIHDFVGISYASQIFSQSNDYTGRYMTNPTFPEHYTKAFRSRITIGRHVIIGAGSVVLPGVTIEEGCAIGAHSTVLSSTQPWGVYVGSPARWLRERHKDVLSLEAQYLEEMASAQTELRPEPS